MSIGGLIAYKKSTKYLNIYIVNILSIVGLASISTIIWFINDESEFLGYLALVPTLSAAFLILAGN
jgi:peptidoglycan/LPS O-acetylase OafA/YrhL